MLVYIFAAAQDPAIAASHALRPIGRRVKMQWGMGSSHSKQVEPRRDNSPNSSAFLGVSWHRSTRRWHAYITVDSQQHSLGYYVDEEEAARVHDAGARMVRLFQDFNVPSKPFVELSCMKSSVEFLPWSMKIPSGPPSSWLRTEFAQDVLSASANIGCRVTRRCTARRRW